MRQIIRGSLEWPRFCTWYRPPCFPCYQLGSAAGISPLKTISWSPWKPRWRKTPLQHIVAGPWDQWSSSSASIYGSETLLCPPNAWHKTKRVFVRKCLIGSLWQFFGRCRCTHSWWGCSVPSSLPGLQAQSRSPVRRWAPFQQPIDGGRREWKLDQLQRDLTIFFGEFVLVEVLGCWVWSTLGSTRWGRGSGGRMIWENLAINWKMSHCGICCPWVFISSLHFC